jgi:hypothetical protein
MSNSALVWHNKITIKIDATDLFKTGNVFIMPCLPQKNLVLITGAVYGVITVSIPNPNLLDCACI